VDFWPDDEGRPCLLEINTLPGLNPTYSDIVLAARAKGYRTTGWFWRSCIRPPIAMGWTAQTEDSELSR